MDSILSQTMDNFEVLAVNDHSDDASENIINSFMDHRIKCVKATGVGLVDALNQGISLAKSDYIARMDADDVMHPERLKMQLQLMVKNPSISIVGSVVQLFPHQETNRGHQNYVEWINKCITHEQISNKIYLEAPFAHPSVMFLKKDILALGGYREGDFPEDYDLWLRAIQSGLQVAKVDHELLAWRDTDTRLSRNHDMYRREAFDRLRSEYLVKDQRLSTSKKAIIWGAGRVTRKRVRLIQDRGIKVVAWIDVNPAMIGNIIDDARVYPPEVLSGQEKQLILVYVSNRGARDNIDAFFHEIGFKEGVNYLHVG